MFKAFQKDSTLLQRVPLPFPDRSPGVRITLNVMVILNVTKGELHSHLSLLNNK